MQVVPSGGASFGTNLSHFQGSEIPALYWVGLFMKFNARRSLGLKTLAYSANR